MTNKRYTFPILFCLLTNLLPAQSPLNLSMKTGTMKGKQEIKYQNGSFSDNGSREESGNGSISLAFSLPVKKGFRLGTEIGMNTFETFLDYNFTFGSSFESHYTGRYRINQAYFAIVPEYRLIKSVYVNAGAGYYADINSNFTDGNRYTPTDLGIDIEALTGWSYKRFNSLGYFVGAGFCPNLTNELAVLAEIRYTGSPASTDSPDQIGFGYHAFIFNIGLMFKPR